MRKQWLSKLPGREDLIAPAMNLRRDLSAMIHVQWQMNYRTTAAWGGGGGDADMAAQMRRPQRA